MAVVSEPPRAVYAAAVETLAGGIVRALEGAGDTFRLADQLGGLGDWTAGLAAVRVLGPDALLPFTLGPHRFGPDDAEVIAASLRAFPAPEPQVNADHGVLPVRALRDWATGQVLTRLGVTDFRLDPPTLPHAAVDSTWTVWAGGSPGSRRSRRPDWTPRSTLGRAPAGWTLPGG